MALIVRDPPVPPSPVALYGSDSVSFTPAGLGAITTRTVQDALRAMVRSGDYDTSANFNAAQAALTGKLGVKELRLGTGNADGIVLPSLGAAPFQVSVGGGTFNGTFDPTFSIQYNYGRAVATEPLLNLGFEGDYNDGSAHYCEINLDYTAKDGIFSGRQFAWNINRATNVGVWAFVGGTLRFESISNAGELTFSPSLGKISRSVADGNLTTAATAKTSLFLSNSSGGVGNLSATIQFDVGGGQAGAKIYSESNGGSGGILHFATDNGSGAITDRWKIDTNGSLVATGAGAIGFGDGAVGSPTLVLGSVTGSGFYKGGFGTLSYSNGGTEAIAFGGGFGLGSGSVVQWSSTAAGSGAADIVLVRDAAQVLALKNGTATQELRIYGTTTGPKYLSLKHDGTDGIVDTAASAGKLKLIPTNGSDIQWGKALVALGGGAAPTVGTIGGSGPATAAQNSWLRLLDSAGNACWVPVWK